MSVSRVPEGGSFRLQMKSVARDHWMIVGPFPAPHAAKRLAEDLMSTGELRSVKVEHRSARGGWRTAWSWVLSACLLVVALTGCATGATVIPREVGRLPTPEERQLIDQFVPSVVEAARLEGFTCAKVPVAMKEMREDSVLTTARPSLNPCAFYLVISTVYLRVDSPLEHAGTVAHELGHVVDRDWTPVRAKVPQITREREADAFEIRVLNRLGPEACQAQIDQYKRIRGENLRAWGVEQRATVGTHPSYTERIVTFERDCRGAGR